MHGSPERSPGYPGEHYPPGSPAARPVTVSVGRDGLWLVTSAGEPQVWPFAELVLMRGTHAGDPVQIERRAIPAEVLVVTDRRLLEELRALQPAGMRLASSGGAITGRVLALGVLSLIALALAAYRFGVPALADAAADRVPAAWEREFGAAVVRDLAPESARERDPRVTAPAMALHARFAAAAAGAADGSTLVVSRNDLVNAFAAPGGTVVVTTGLLRALRTPDELAAVLAHELGHVRRKHPIHGMMRQLSLQALIGVLAGDATALSGGIQIAGQLAGLRYSREFEQEADDEAVRLLAREGMSAEALSHALDSITKSAPAAGALPGFLSTHPAPRERRERIAAAAARVRPAEHPAEVVSPAMWEAMKRALPEPKANSARANPGAAR